MTTTLTTDGKRLADALHREGVLHAAADALPSGVLRALNAAAATLFAARDGEGVGLRETLGEIACLTPEPDNKVWTTEPWGDPAIYQTYDETGSPHEIVPDCDDKADREAFGYEQGLHRAAVIARAALGPPVYSSAALARPQPEAKGPVAAGGELEAYLHRQWTWSKNTFGPALRTKGIIQHITKELREIEAKPHDLSEWVDVIILAMDGFWRHGGQPEDLLPAMQAKQDKNFARTWPDWRTIGEDSAIEHDRSGEASTTPPAEAKTPYAGVGEPLCEDERSELRWSRRMIRKLTEEADALGRQLAALTPTRSAGEDDTGVREVLADKPEAWLVTRYWHDRPSHPLVVNYEPLQAEWPNRYDIVPLYRRTLAPQPPKAETPAGADMQEAVERACRAFVGPVWDAQGFTSRRYYRDAMREALAAALSTAPAARPGDEVDGFVLVPREPTEEMQAAGWIDKEDVSPKEIYAAMIAAAPAADGGRNHGG